MKKVFAFIAIVTLVVLMGYTLSTAHKYFSLSFEMEEENKGKNTEIAFVKNIAEKWDDAEIKYYVKLTPFYHKSVVLSRVFDRISGKNATTSLAGTTNNTKTTDDIVLRLRKGYLTLVMDTPDIDYSLNKTIDFAKKLKDKNINFIYLEIPHKLGQDEPSYRKYKNIYYDYSEECEEKIREALKKEGIDIVSVEDNCPEIKADRLKYFFKTDHHWLPQTGLIAGKILAQALNEDYGYDIDTSLFDLENYDVDESTIMLGSLGKKVTQAYCKTEPFPILKPKYESDLTVRIPTFIYTKTGSVEETLYDKSVLKSDNLYTSNRYDMYAYANKDWVSVHNNLVHNGKHILVIKASMANAITPFLACGVEDLDIVDIRAFKRNIYDFINRIKPDTVIMIYGTREFTEKSAFSF